jgi:hypothetical protein
MNTTTEGADVVLYESPIDGALILADGSTSPGWRKSSRSAGNGACVETARTRDGVLVRDSKDPDGPVLVLVTDSWAHFIEDVQAGRFDR